jgi:energy-coupling factor transport system permease protein
VELLAAAATEGLRLAAIVACFGAANALANPYRLLRSLPAVLYELGVALTVALAVVPNTVLTAQRIREARRLRGRRVRGLRSLRGLVMPVLEGALERSVDLAASMDARGYGRRRAPGAVAAVIAPVAVVVGLIGVAVGAYAVLDVGSPGMLGLPVLALGSLLLAVGMVVSGRRVERSRYRPDRWLAAEWLVVALGIAAPVGVAVAAAMDPASVGWTLSPLSWPAVPPVAVVGIAASLVAGVLTPPPVMTLTGLHLATAADPLGGGPAAVGPEPEPEPGAAPGAAPGPGAVPGAGPATGVGAGTWAGAGTGATSRVPELAATTRDGGSA